MFVYGAELGDQSQRRRTMVHGCWKSSLQPALEGAQRQFGGA